jgi:hypothetical protein
MLFAIGEKDNTHSILDNSVSFVRGQEHLLVAAED